jgi:hypothetical protein
MMNIELLSMFANLLQQSWFSFDLLEILRVKLADAIKHEIDITFIVILLKRHSEIGNIV